MQINYEIINRFLANRATAEEAAAVVAFFESHPEELEKYVPLNGLLCEGTNWLSPAASEKILMSVREQYKPEKRLYINVLKYASAAILIGAIIMLGIMPFTGLTDNNKEEQGTAYTAEQDLRSWKTVSNETTTPMLLQMPDGSQVTLFEGSEMKFVEGFEKSKRDILLSGKGSFKVSKDPARPFTVYAGDVSTTALGTLFIVTELQDKKVSVQLIEGSVRVNSRLNGADSTMLLKPGEEVIIGEGYYVTDKMYQPEPVTTGDKQLLNETVSKRKTDPARIVFKNQELDHVFKKIEESFGVEIKYGSGLAVEKKLFTGTFLKTDKLEFILKTICQMHTLQYEIADNRITITAL